MRHVPEPTSMLTSTARELQDLLSPLFVLLTTTVHFYGPDLVGRHLTGSFGAGWICCGRAALGWTCSSVSASARRA